MDYDIINELQAQLHNNTVEHWLQDEFLSISWWVLFTTFIIFIVIWWKLLDKSRAMEIGVYGLLVAVMAGMLDSMGSSLGLWGYPIKLLPFNPPLLPIDFVYLPVMYMLILQYFSKWKAFVIANIAAALFYAWVGEPLFKWLGIYEAYNWSTHYSIPIYFTIALGLRWMTEKLMMIQKKQQK